ncbi:MAG: virulence-associated E family protein [Prolixibacteraceae bacterium]
MKDIKPKYDGSFDIATGRSRKETHWRNAETTWAAFLNRVKETHRTAEKLSEYMAEKKTRQDEIKDIGGYVGGYVNGGRRKSGSITHRQLVTLDIDFGKGGTWEDLILYYGNAAAVYSTHKHTPGNPRLRLVMPLDRPVTTDEYIAIARRIAGNLDINSFDDTTFEPTRLMYWPSTAKDAEYVFEYQDGPWLCADEVLGSYRNWRDASEWPISDRTSHVIRQEIKKQGDPLEKPGVVGAFCRTYSIDEAIEMFLSDVYESCDVEGRYTYLEGSTAAGLVVYDDKYAYSHHGTDPASGKLCNAFDLVRLHKFGLQDEDAKEGTPGNRMPSYRAMLDFARRDGATKERIVTEKVQDARSDFEGLEGEEPEEPEDTEWTKGLDVDGKGNIKSTINNIRIILDNDPAVKGRFAMNKFEQREVTLRDLPWRKLTSGQYLTDKDDAGIRDYLEKTYDITGVQKIKDAMDLTTEKNAFHPVKDYLSSLEWDGECRVDTLFIEYLGAADDEYVRAVTRKTLVAAVARIFVPGIKFDYVPILIGKQGIGKSTIIKKLGQQWYSDSFGTIQGKEAFEQIQGVWLLEMGELAGLKKAEMETVKHFISKQEDRYRVAYGRRTENFPRQCVFIGTTNENNFLRDYTGNRRFWPIDTHETEVVRSLFKDFTQSEIDQTWAEAVYLFKAGEPLYLSKEIEKLAAEQQAEHNEIDERAGLVQQYLDTLLPENWDEMDLGDRRIYLTSGDDIFNTKGKIIRQRVCVAELWCELFGQKQSEMTSFNTKSLHGILKNMEGWKEHKSAKSRFKIYGHQKAYLRTLDVQNLTTNVTTDKKSVTT